MTRTVIIGAGPYGLSVAAHLSGRNVPFRIFGKPLDTWRHHMPSGMVLKSDAFASNLSAPGDAGTLREYCLQHRIPYHDTDVPVSLELFNTYATDFQSRFVPMLEERQVVSLAWDGREFAVTLDDGEELTADVVVAAVGITHFAKMPVELEGLPAPQVTHSSAHSDLSSFAGRDVVVIGAGSSAVDLAVLLAEAGATTALVARGQSIRFASEPVPAPRSLADRLLRPSSGLGPGWRSWVCQKLPNLFKFLPGRARSTIVRRHLGPKSAWAMRSRFDAAVSVSLGERVERAVLEDGRVRLTLRNTAGATREVVTDHVIAGTGYYPDVGALTFMSERLRQAIRTHERMPVVSGSFESSVDGLYFVGIGAVDSFGPLMRFMVGAEYVAPRVARTIARRGSRPRRAAGS